MPGCAASSSQGQEALRKQRGIEGRHELCRVTCSPPNILKLSGKQGGRVDACVPQLGKQAPDLWLIFLSSWFLLLPGSQAFHTPSQPALERTIFSAAATATKM